MATAAGREKVEGGGDLMTPSFFCSVVLAASGTAWGDGPQQDIFEYTDALGPQLLELDLPNAERDCLFPFPICLCKWHVNTLLILVCFLSFVLLLLQWLLRMLLSSLSVELRKSFYQS